MSFNHSFKRASDKGSVITEFAIVLPLLVVFFIGISGIGQLLGHVTWISQTTYAAAMFASDVPKPDGAAKVELETTRLLGAQSRGQVTGDWSVPTYSEGHITGKPIVSVSVPAAHVTPLIHTFFPTNVRVSVAAPYLVPNESAFAGFGDFGNPSQASGCTGSCNPGTPYVPGRKDLEILPINMFGGVDHLLGLTNPASEAMLYSLGETLQKYGSTSETLDNFAQSYPDYEALLLKDTELADAVATLLKQSGLSSETRTKEESGIIVKK